MASSKFGSRAASVFVVALVIVLTLSGVGGRITEFYENINKSERLAALALVIGGVPRDAMPVTLLAIDDRTRLAWGNPQSTPHAALAGLAGLAQKSGARAILLDFDLSSEAGTVAADPALLAFLSSYPANAPTLMMARKVRFIRGEHGVEADSTGATPYDQAASGHGNMRWVTTVNHYGDGRAVKQIRLWQSICRGERPAVLPSPALVSAAPDPAALDDFLAHAQLQDCPNGESLPEPEWRPRSGQAVTIPYVIGSVDGNAGRFNIPQGQGKTLAFRQISARLLVTRNPDGSYATAQDVDPASFANRIVVIGATHADTGDLYETPFGSMAGVTILANTLITARSMVETGPVPQVVVSGLALLLMLWMVWLNRRLLGVPAALVIGASAAIVLFTVARLLGFSAGLKVVALAFAAFALFKIIDGLFSIAKSWHAKRWRAFLKG
jgi:CHASE2 domain-containing sensor protein